MSGRNLLLLSAVFMILGFPARCQQTPQVSMSPTFTTTFSGDSIKLSCDNSTAGVTWYFNNAVDPQQKGKTWSIAAATPRHSGSYQCESDGRKSGNFSISVLEYLPPASLSIWTGQPVMWKNNPFSLVLQSDDGLQGWNCWVYKGGRVRKITFKKLQDEGDGHIFQPYHLSDPEAIYWCSDKTNQSRSSPVTIRTSEKKVLLEMLSRPAMTGESLTLKCLAWGTDQISRAIFYKDEVVIQDGDRSAYHINNVTASSEGEYKCTATFTYRGRTAGPPYTETSDVQELFVHEPPLKAVLSADPGMSCSCPNCPSGASYRWYHKQLDQQWEVKTSGQSYTEPSVAGSYACRAVWPNKRTLLSNVYIHNDDRPNWAVMIVIGLLIVGAILLLVALVCYKKRNNTEAIYQDVPLTGVRSAEGEYEALKREAMKNEEYQTLGAEGGARGDGGYEALGKREKEEYEKLENRRDMSAEGGYEALGKREREEYEKLENRRDMSTEGGYEALGKREKEEYEKLENRRDMSAEGQQMYN
ncbi:uncharacterized protein [Centroberyx affinis]|uniref:uncharacterized protein n=1 Tax=Centroberyx affinis TaxID=166261 RepID=UPI003A5C0FB8